MGKLRLIFIISFFLYSCQIILAQKLNPGDGIRLTFYNITDQISGDYFVQTNGTVQLPFIGIVDAERKEYEELKKEIELKYDSLYRDPELIVRPLYKINILGEVKTPGSYFVTGVERLSDIIAQAGGETSDADIDDIYVERKDSHIEVNGSQIIEKGNNNKDFRLMSGDRIYVPRKWWVGARNIAMIASGAALLITLAGIFISK